MAIRHGYLKRAAECLLLRRRNSGGKAAEGTRRVAAKTDLGPGRWGHLGQWQQPCVSPRSPRSAREGAQDRPRFAAFDGSSLARVEGIPKLAFDEAFRRSPSRTLAGNSSSARPARLEGKVAVVTGGASGIGEATVRAFVEHGARAVIADIQDGPGQQLAEELGGSAVVRYVHCDVTDEAQVAAAVETAAQAFGSLDVLHNNAGIVGALGPLEKISVDHWDATFRVLVRSYFLGIKYAARIMKDQGVGGAIINTASVAGVVSGLAPHCYTICKTAVVGLTKSAAAELRAHRVRVNAISPGAVMTPLLLKHHKLMHGELPSIQDAAIAAAEVRAQESIVNERGGDEERLAVWKAKADRYGSMPTVADIAGVAVFLACDEATFVTGQNLVVDGGFTVAPQSTPETLASAIGSPGMMQASEKLKDS